LLTKQQTDMKLLHCRNTAG